MSSRQILRRGLSSGVSVHASSIRRPIISKLSSASFTDSKSSSTLSQASPRTISTEFITPSSASELLISQRLRRPVSPHLAIYRLSINYFTSPTHRVTGLLLSVPFYLFGISYLAAPVLGWQIDGASLAAAFGTLSPGLKTGLKFLMAWPLTFHGVNGVGHLIWDSGRRFSTRAIVRQGWTVVGLSLVGAGWLAWFV